MITTRKLHGSEVIGATKNANRVVDVRKRVTIFFKRVQAATVYHHAIATIFILQQEGRQGTKTIERLYKDGF